MKNFLRTMRVVARRDFFAVVGTPTFIIFLLAPLFMIGLGVLGGSGAASVATSSENAARIAAIASPVDSAALTAADARLRAIMPSNGEAPKLESFAPQGDAATQASNIMSNKKADYFAVLYGPLDRPNVLHEESAKNEARWLARMADDVMRDRKAALNPDSSAISVTLLPVKAVRPGLGLQQTVGYAAIFVIFLLTTLLASQAVGMLAEEKSNKVIEILAASAQLEAVFLGKLVGMLGVSILFVSFWGGLIGLGIALDPTLLAIVKSWTPAVGMPTFLALCGAYFIMSYMLMGALLLGTGGLASTIRELQMMSLPVTLLQIGMYVLSSKAAGSPGSTVARVAEILPFSSPMAMAAHASTDASLRPHLLALPWQAFWIGFIIWLMARLFRFGVLKSGGWKAFFGRKATT